MAGLGYLLMFLSCLCPLAIFVLFLIFIIRAIMKRKKKWLGISAAICSFLMLPMFIGGAILVGSDEEFQAEYGASSTELEATTSGTKATSVAVTFPPELTTMTEPPPETTLRTTEPPPVTQTTTTEPPPVTEATTTRPPETTTTEPPTTFEEVYLAYQENELRASEIYKGERIRFSGTVNSVSESFLGTTTVWFDVYAQGQEHWVICSFTTKQNKEDLMELTVGDYVTVEGTCVDWMSWGLCEIVD